MKTRWVGIVAAVCLSVVVLLGACWLVLIAPPRLVGGEFDGITAAERLAAVHTVREQMIKFVGGMGALILAGFGLYRYWLDKAKQRLDEDKHLLGSFDSAAGRLAADEPHARATGVRALVRFLRDSPRDHLLALESICDVLRRYAIAPENAVERPGELPFDVAAAVSALRERPLRDEPGTLDLTGVWLRGAYLRGVRLRGALLGRGRERTADLTRADLTEADLTDAHWPFAQLAGATLAHSRIAGAQLRHAELTGADLNAADGTGVQLPDAVLFTADLTNAVLRGANLRGARFRGAIMASTDLTDADLTGADLTGTDLRTVLGLTEAMVRTALVDSSTALPPALDHPDLEPLA